MKKANLYGILASLFFAFTFILNRSMNLAGGSYLWSSSLRYLFMLPMLWLLIKRNNGTQKVYDSIRQAKGPWFLWSTIGFGLFYLPLSFASNYGASWLVAGSWQLTIIAGALLTPLWGKKIPKKTLLFSCIIIAGVFLLQFENASSLSFGETALCIVPVLIAAVAYPLGNRKMMDVCKDQLSTLQRIYGMTLCSLPFWLIVAACALVTSGVPSSTQITQSFLVAIFSGVIATILFFQATDLVKHNEKQLAIIEATQAGEVIFTLLGSILFLHDSVPSMLGIAGLILIIAGMLLNTLCAAK